MRAAHTSLDVAAVEAALRQLPRRAERHLRRRFGIGTRAVPPRTLAPAATRRHVLEAAAFRTLRRQALQPLPRQTDSESSS